MVSRLDVKNCIVANSEPRKCTLTEEGNKRKWESGRKIFGGHSILGSLNRKHHVGALATQLCIICQSYEYTTENHVQMT